MIATLVSSIILIAVYGGWNANDRTRTPIVPESPHNEQGIGFGLGPG